MNENILSLTVSSVEELDRHLSRLRSIERRKINYLVLTLNSPDVITQSFSFHNLPMRKLKDQIQMEAIELLNLPANQLVFDFQIFQASKETVSGIFTCVAKERLLQFSNTAQKYKMSLVLTTTYLLSTLNSFLIQQKNSEGRFALLDFSKDNSLHLAVVHGRQFELLRKVSFDNTNEIQKEIYMSLRSASAKSKVKEFDAIYFYGDIPEKEKLVAEIEGMFQTKGIIDEKRNVENDLISKENVFSINLMRNFCMTLEERKRAFLTTHFFLGLCLLGNVFLGFKVHEQSRIIQSLRTEPDQSYDIAQNQDAKETVKL